MPILKNARQERFCQELMIDDNATQAYIRAGYKDTDTARTSASKLLANPNICARVSELREERSVKLQIDADWVLFNLKEVYERCKVVEPVYEYRNNVRKETGMYKFDSSGALKALEMIGRHIGFFNKKDNDDDSSGWSLLKVLKQIEAEEKEIKNVYKS